MPRKTAVMLHKTDCVLIDTLQSATIQGISWNGPTPPVNWRRGSARQCCGLGTRHYQAHPSPVRAPCWAYPTIHGVRGGQSWTERAAFHRARSGVHRRAQHGGGGAERRHCCLRHVPGHWASLEIFQWVCQCIHEIDLRPRDVAIASVGRLRWLGVAVNAVLLGCGG